MLIHRIFLTFASALLLLVLSGCRVTFAPASPTETPTPSATPTATIQWFPPTPTPSPFPTPNAAPTADLRPGIGELLLEDDFSDGEAWTTGSDNEGLAQVSGGGLLLGLTAERSYLFSTRNAPVF
ncbi:MAG: hypothetical protein WD740_04595, partial [Anaerolineales bacterium]